MAFQHFTENSENYALVISDLRMPNLNGLELLKKVKTLNPKVRTILMSAYNFNEDELYQKYMKEAVINSKSNHLLRIKRLLLNSIKTVDRQLCPLLDLHPSLNSILRQ
jgi:YesN/AraC family two-component response regulator